jgi:hypothetical protein
MAESQIKTLMKLAGDDVEVFELLCERSNLHTAAGFHAQQAAEKTMNQTITWARSLLSEVLS